MLNKAFAKQTLVATLMLAPPAAADPPGALAFRDWWRDCPLRSCPIHTAVTGADGSEVLRVAVSGPPPALAVTTPLPLFLPDGIVLALGTPPERRCRGGRAAPAGCEATLPLDPDLAAALRRERGGSVTLTLVDGVQVRLPFSLLGFSAALAARG